VKILKQKKKVFPGDAEAFCGDRRWKGKCMGCLVDLTWQRNICFFFIKKKVFLKEINFFCFKLIKKNIF
jgi:hypothetical protein